MALTNTDMEKAVRGYFDACNAADLDALISFFTPEAVHYFPQGSPFGAVRGAQAIAENWVECVDKLGSWWTVDRYIGDADKREAVIEWTHFKPKVGGYLRGDEWYKFDSTGLITEIRAYYACSAHAGVAQHEIAEYPYAEQAYPLTLPEEATRAGR